jgi:periplasmic copper chaperone A
MTSQHTTSRLRRATVVMTIGLLAIGASACGDDSTDSADTAAPTTVAAVTIPAVEVAITGQWARTSPADAANGAAYLTITSPIDDKLVGAVVDPSVAGMSQIHETVMAESTDTTVAMGSETTMAGMGEMTMQPVDFIDLPAGTAVEMKPGGYHIMMMDLAAPLAVGTTIQVTLTLEKAGEIVVDVPVLDEAP